MKNLNSIKNKNIINFVLYIGLILIYWFFIDIFNQKLIVENFKILNYFKQEAFIFNLLWMSFLILVLYITKNNIRKYLGLSINIILLVFSLINYFMVSYFNCVFSWKDLILSGEGLSFISSIFKFINFKIIVFTIISISINLFIFRLSKFDLYRLKTKQSLIIIIFLICICFGYIKNEKKLSNTTDGWDAEKILANKANYYTHWLEPNKLLNISGTFQYIVKDFYMSFFYKHQVKDADKIIKEYIESNKKNSLEFNYKGIFKNKNLIIVMMESLDDWLINEEITPTISHMMRHGFNFKNHYSPAYVTGLTANTEFVANTGIYPNIGYMSPNYAYINNSYPFSLANIFKENGYKVNSFHIADSSIYNRKKMHKKLGYDKYHSFVDMGINYNNIEYDSHIIKDGYNKIALDEKFMSFIITYTGHTPYKYTDPKCRKNLNDIKDLNIIKGLNEEQICALSAAREIDNMFKLLIEKLKEDDKLDNTIIIGFTDHPNNLYLRSPETEVLNKTLFFIYDSSMKKNEINTLTSSINILPTIVNLFNINTRFVYPGYDALNTEKEYIIFKDYTYYDGKNINPINKELEAHLKYSKSILVSDYFKD